MTEIFDPKDTPDGEPPGSAAPRTKRPRSSPDIAFDIWLQRSLHTMFDGVAAEPIPAELLALIEKDRTARR